MMQQLAWVEDDVHKALATDARLVHPSWDEFATAGRVDIGRSGNLVAEVFSDGDVDAVFARADRIVEGTYRAPRQYQAYLEPKMALATYEAGRYTIQVSHQFPFRLRDRGYDPIGWQ